MKRHPSTIIVDPIDNVRSVVSRVRCCQKLSSIIASYHDGNSPIKQPKYFVADTEDEAFMGFHRLMEMTDMHYPVICKPITACGTPESHHMVFIYIDTFIYCYIAF